jgi:hypothetical protein
LENPFVILFIQKINFLLQLLTSKKKYHSFYLYTVNLHFNTQIRSRVSFAPKLFSRIFILCPFHFRFLFVFSSFHRFILSLFLLFLFGSVSSTLLWCLFPTIATPTGCLWFII